MTDQTPHGNPDGASPATPTPLTCPLCGYLYPLGSVQIAGEIFDPVVESGGRAHRCSSFGNSSQGLFQTLQSTFGTS